MRIQSVQSSETKDLLTVRLHTKCLCVPRRGLLFSLAYLLPCQPTELLRGTRRFSMRRRWAHLVINARRCLCAGPQHDGGGVPGHHGRQHCQSCLRRWRRRVRLRRRTRVATAAQGVKDSPAVACHRVVHVGFACILGVSYYQCWCAFGGLARALGGGRAGAWREHLRSYRAAIETRARCLRMNATGTV